MSQAVNKKRVVVVCPGRGTYNKEELGYLRRYHSDKTEIVDLIDEYRAGKQQLPIAQLDQMDKYAMRTHTAGENASALIYACALSDYFSIDKEEYEVAAVTGNSMGWYIALAVAGALTQPNAIEVINTMGSMMENGIIGGQMIYPIVDENWHVNYQQKEQVLMHLDAVNQLADCQVYMSIELGGYLVFGGNNEGLKALGERLPMIEDRYPMNLFNHAAFHTPLMANVSKNALEQLPVSLFQQPNIPLVDGRGQIWQPYSCDLNALHDYTLNTQVVEPYQFSKAIEVAIKEFAPDKLIVLGPGATLGGAIAQCLISHQWLGMTSKADFIDKQKTSPFVLAMGIETQRQQAVTS